MQHHDYQPDPEDPKWCAVPECQGDEDDTIHKSEDECDGGDCEAAEVWHVEISKTVRFTVRAHTENEASDIAERVTISVDDASGDFDDWEEEDDQTIESESEIAATEARRRQFIAEYEAEEAARTAAEAVTTS